MERHNRHFPSHTLRAAGAALGLILIAGLFGCGGKEASTDAVIAVDSADANWTLPDNYGNGVNTIAPIQPILIQVQKSVDDPTPIPGADITVLVGGIAIGAASVVDPVTSTVLDNGFGVLQTQTDDHGSLVVLPIGTVTGCTAVPASDTNVSGNLSLGIFISSDSASWNGNFTYTCLGP
jgi:hypothetical protein